MFEATTEVPVLASCRHTADAQSQFLAACGGHSRATIRCSNIDAQPSATTRKLAKLFGDPEPGRAAAVKARSNPGGKLDLDADSTGFGTTFSAKLWNGQLGEQEAFFRLFVLETSAKRPCVSNKSTENAAAIFRRRPDIVPKCLRIHITTNETKALSSAHELL